MPKADSYKDGMKTLERKHLVVIGLTKMKIKEYRRRTTRTLKFSEYWNDSDEYLGGGILNSVRSINNEIWVQVFDDLVMDEHSERIGSTGRLQIHIGGTRRAFEELGTFLLALAYFEPPKLGYNLHIDVLDENNEPAIHFVVQLPINDIKEKRSYEKIINIGTATIGEDGETKETTTLPIKLPRNQKKSDI